MAQSLYREWFVHFRFPRDSSEASAKAGGHESATFKDSELGRIPEGWEVMPVEVLLDSHIGGGWGKESQDEKHSESAFVIRGTDIPDARECGISGVPFRFHSASNLKSRRLEPDDIVFEVSGGSKGQPVGRSLFVSDRLLNAFGGADVMCASFCKLLRPRAEILAPKLLLYHFLEIYEDGRIDAYQVQSTGITNFKFTPFLEQEMLLIPPRNLQMRWQAVADNLLNEASLLVSKNQTLRRTRDLLLPKLLSSDAST
jgi:type I restriction enzyme S subunit